MTNHARNLERRNAEHGKPTDEPDPNGSTHARLNWWKDNCDRAEERNAELTELLATARDMMKQSHEMEVSALKKRNAELVEALGRVANSSTIIDEFDVEWAAATDTVDVANAALDRNGGGK